MSRRMRKGIIGLIAMAAALSAMAPVVAAAEQHSPLRLQKFHYTLDGGGQPYLALRFINESTKPVDAVSIAPDPKGPWTTLNQTIAPGDTLRTQFKSPEGGVATVWINSKQGLLKYDLPKRH